MPRPRQIKNLPTTHDEIHDLQVKSEAETKPLQDEFIESLLKEQSACAEYLRQYRLALYQDVFKRTGYDIRFQSFTETRKVMPPEQEIRALILSLQALCDIKLSHIAERYQDGELTQADAAKKIRQHFRRWQRVFVPHIAYCVQNRATNPALQNEVSEFLSAYVRANLSPTTPQGGPSRLKIATEQQNGNFQEAIEEEAPGAIYAALADKERAQREAQDKIRRDIDDPAIFDRAMSALAQRTGIFRTPEEIEAIREEIRALLDSPTPFRALPPSAFHNIVRVAEGVIEKQLSLQDKERGETKRQTDSGENIGAFSQEGATAPDSENSVLKMAIRQEADKAEDRGEKSVAETYRLLLDGNTSATDIARTQGKSPKTIDSRLKSLGNRLEDSDPKK